MPIFSTHKFSRIPKLLPVIILAGSCCLAVFTDHSGLRAGSEIPAEDSVGREAEIKELVEHYSNLEDCHIEDIHWFGLSSDLETELIVHYMVGDRITWFTDVYSFADPGKPVRLFHGDGPFKFLHCRYDDANYLFAYYRHGSGGFLTGTLFSWDGVGPLNSEYSTESGFKGWVAVANGQFCFSGDSKFYRVEKTPTGFDPVEYGYDISYPDLGQTVHILKSVEVTPDSLAITLDGRRVPFILTQDDEYFRGYGSRDTFHIGLNEEILVIGGGCSYSPDDFQGQLNGLVTSFRPRKMGDMWLAMSPSPNFSYSLNFKVSGPVFWP